MLRKRPSAHATHSTHLTHLTHSLTPHAARVNASNCVLQLLNAPSSLTAQTTRDRALALGLVRQAPQLVTATLAYVATVNQLMAQGLTLAEANRRLRLRKRGKLHTFVPMSATSVAAEREALLK